MNPHSILTPLLHHIYTIPPPHSTPLLWLHQCYTTPTRLLNQSYTTDTSMVFNTIFSQYHPTANPFLSIYPIPRPSSLLPSIYPYTTTTSPLTPTLQWSYTTPILHVFYYTTFIASLFHLILLLWCSTQPLHHSYISPTQTLRKNLSNPYKLPCITPLSVSYTVSLPSLFYFYIRTHTTTTSPNNSFHKSRRRSTKKAAAGEAALLPDQIITNKGHLKNCAVNRCGH